MTYDFVCARPGNANSTWLLYIPDCRSTTAKMNTTATMSVSFPARHRPRLYDSQHEQHAGLRFGVAARAEEFIPTSCKPPCFVGQEHARRYPTALMNRGISPALQVAPSIRQFLLPAEEDGCRSVVRVSSFTFGARIFGGPAGALLLVPPSRKPRKQNRQEQEIEATSARHAWF